MYLMYYGVVCGVEMPSISVIVPVYNVEKYLAICIESIIRQSFRDIEILLLNDGSTDSSLEICNEYAKKDSRISVFSHSNRGLGPTRNRGISLACGEYLAFVDSDDYISDKGLELLYKKAVSINADIVEAETLVFMDGDEEHGHIRVSLNKAEDLSIDESNIEDFYKYYYFARTYSHNAWDKIYKREFVINNHLLFGDNHRIFAEDNWFQLQAIRQFPTIGFLPYGFYWYRQQNESIMHKPKKDLVTRHGNMILDYQSIIKGSKIENLEKQVCSVVAADVLTMEALNSKKLNRTRKEFLRTVKEVKNNEALKTSICDLYIKKGFELYQSNRQRKKYLTSLGFLYKTGMYNIAHNLVWFLYYIR